MSLLVFDNENPKNKIVANNKIEKKEERIIFDDFFIEVPSFKPSPNQPQKTQPQPKPHLSTHKATVYVHVLHGHSLLPWN